MRLGWGPDVGSGLGREHECEVKGELVRCVPHRHDVAVDAAGQVVGDVQGGCSTPGVSVMDNDSRTARNPMNPVVAPVNSDA